MLKRSIHTAILAMMVLLTGSCKQEFPAPFIGKNYIQFTPTNGIKTVVTAYSSFYYADPSKTTDTILFDVTSLGLVPDKTTYLKLSPILGPIVTTAYPNAVDAVPGVNYVSFDDPGIQKLMKLDAGKTNGKIPVVIKRDPSLKTTMYQLHFKLSDSEDYLAGNPKYIEGLVYISDFLFKPTNWSTTFFLGTYGTVKHQFMVEQSGERWDLTFITTILANSNLQTYYKYKFSQALKATNAARIAAGQTELRENPSDPTTAITFPTL